VVGSRSSTKQSFFQQFQRRVRERDHVGHPIARPRLQNPAGLPPARDRPAGMSWGVSISVAGGRSFLYGRRAAPQHDLRENDQFPADLTWRAPAHRSKNRAIRRNHEQRQWWLKCAPSVPNSNPMQTLKARGLLRREPGAVAESGSQRRPRSVSLPYGQAHYCPGFSMNWASFEGTKKTRRIGATWENRR
jgi:hypothetical protein